MELLLFNIQKNGNWIHPFSMVKHVIDHPWMRYRAFNQMIQKDQNVAHNLKWNTFEVIFGLPFLVAVALHFLVPLSLSKGYFTVGFITVGILFIIVGLYLIIRARRELAKHNQPTDPGHPTSKLITTGVFSISRNPLYLGGTCMLTGIALALNLVWVLMSLTGSVIACHYLLIIPEERYLATKFGAEYHEYTATVCRWLGSN